MKLSAQQVAELRSLHDNYKSATRSADAVKAGMEHVIAVAQRRIAVEAEMKENVWKALAKAAQKYDLTIVELDALLAETPK